MMAWHLLAAFPVALIALAALVDASLTAICVWRRLTTERFAR